MILNKPAFYTGIVYFFASIAVVIASMVGAVDHYDAKLAVGILTGVFGIAVSFLLKEPKNG